MAHCFFCCHPFSNSTAVMSVELFEVLKVDRNQRCLTGGSCAAQRCARVPG